MVASMCQFDAVDPFESRVGGHDHPFPGRKPAENLELVRAPAADLDAAPAGGGAVGGDHEDPVTAAFLEEGSRRDRDGRTIFAEAQLSLQRLARQQALRLRAFEGEVDAET